MNSFSDVKDVAVLRGQCLNIAAAELRDKNVAAEAVIRRARELFEEALKQGFQIGVDEEQYAVLGVSPLSSNEEVEKRFKQLIRTFHPDMALSEEAKKEFSRRAAEINEAYTSIKKERGL